MVGVPVLYWGGDIEDLEEMKVHGTFFEIDYVFNVIYIDAYVDLYALFKRMLIHYLSMITNRIKIF